MCCCQQLGAHQSPLQPGTAVKGPFHTLRLKGSNAEAWQKCTLHTESRHLVFLECSGAAHTFPLQMEELRCCYEVAVESSMACCCKMYVIWTKWLTTNITLCFVFNCPTEHNASALLMSKLKFLWWQIFTPRISIVTYHVLVIQP